MAGMHPQRARQIDRNGPLPVRTSPPPLTATPVFVAFLALLLLAAACSTGPEDVAEPARPANTIRSSGALFNTSEDGGRLQAVRPENPDASGLISDELDTFSDAGDGGDGPQSRSDEDSEIPAAPPAPRPDGIELVFADGRLGPIAPGSTIEDIGEALGPLYIIQEEPFIRVGFEGGYSVSRSGEVRFWAVEEAGIITMLMTTHPTVGLDSGLRPTMAIDDAVALHGPPVLTIGPESREFVVFADGTGAATSAESEEATDDQDQEDPDEEEQGQEAPEVTESAAGSVVVLVAIGRFGGPVGIYQGAVTIGAETSAFLREDATIKELWFPLG